jgi:hypothetical protein
MNAQALLDKLKARDIRLAPRPSGNLCLAPRDRLTPELLEAVRLHKVELLRLLTWDSAAGADLRVTLARIEQAAAAQPPQIRDRITDLLAQSGQTIDALFVAQDLDSLRYALRDLERNIRDAVAARGYDNERPEARPTCPVCKGACPWCRRTGILRCGACYPPARQHR